MDESSKLTLFLVVIASLMLATLSLAASVGSSVVSERRTVPFPVIDSEKTAPSGLPTISQSNTLFSETTELCLDYDSSWTAEGNQADAFFGYSVASAGDVNGDGYQDVIVGAPLFSVDGGDEGRVFLYLGSLSGLSSTPSWTADGLHGGFGYSVASAGDVNGDGFDDVVIGEPGYDDTESNQGRAVLYLGSSLGLPEVPSWFVEGDQAYATLGNSVASAGDVNNDGYDDVVIGAAGYGIEGRVYLFEGSDSGLSVMSSWTVTGEQAGESFGRSVASAGDVNNDSYDDVVIGSDSYGDGESFEGRAYLYMGSSSGLDVSFTWAVEGNQSGAYFGSSVGSAGDVDDDGYDDVVIGAKSYDGGEPGEGRVHLYLGSSSGLSAAPSWIAEGNEDYAFFGTSVASAGDVNDDGYDDVIIGATSCGYGPLGRAFLYLGSASGLSTISLWTTESDQVDAYLGFSVASAGDVNGDGYDDVVIGAHGYDNGETNEGCAYSFRGSTSGVHVAPSWLAEGNQTGAGFGFSVASAGDVNGDGFDDVVVGAPGYDNGEGGEGCAFLYLGSPSGFLGAPSWVAESNQTNANFGRSVASAGDVNGDGYDDVVIGADGYDNGETNEGRAFLYLGSSSGLSVTPSWTAEGGQPAVWYGAPVASAGDVNGDGFDDVVVGGCCYDNGELEEGRAYLYLGSPSGLSTTPSWTAEGNMDYAFFGSSVASAGDVNGDGCDDVVIGAVCYDNGEENEGRAYLYLGSPTGLPSDPSWTAEGNQDYAFFGTSVASAGDVDGDGFDDVVVGAHGYDNGETDEGRAYLYLGSPTGLSASPSWTAESDQANANFGRSVASAGDVNGDGYDDVVIGVWYYDNGETDEGRVCLYLGSSSGLSTTPSWAAEGDQDDAHFGTSVASAGDVNGDDFADVVTGAPHYDNGEETEGCFSLYLGYGKYLVTFDQMGLSGDAVDAVVTVNGEPKTYGQLPYSVWVERGSTFVYSYEETVLSVTEGRQYSIVAISGPSSPVSVTSSVTVVGSYDCSPTADAGPDQMVDENTLVTFDGSASSDDIAIVNFTWRLTDGTVKTLYEVNPTYTFEIAGTYVVTLTVEDAEGETSTDTVTIMVEEKGFIEAYGLPLGIVIALVAIALILLFVLKDRKNGRAPTSIDEASTGGPEVNN